MISLMSLAKEADVKAHSVGDKVPNFEVRTLKGRRTTLKDIQSDRRNNTSGVTVLTFWCSFCGSCRMVDKPLSELSQKYEGKVAILALDASAGEQARTISKVLKEKNLKMPVLIDSAGDLADLFGAKMTTTTVVIDANNVVQYWGQFQQGDNALAAEAIEAVLAGKKPLQEHTRERG
jgi:thiol-disulfide isomerase/thioredoxin